MGARNVVLIVVAAAVLVAAGVFLATGHTMRWGWSGGVSVEDVTVVHGGLALPGWVIAPRGDGSRNRTGIVLLHGTGPEGKNLLLYRALAGELAARGFSVLLYDQRGYGDAPDPPVASDGDYDLDFVGDAIEAARVLARSAAVDPSRILVVGHSFGGSVSIGVSRAVRPEDPIAAIVTISPGRGLPHTGERVWIFRQERLSEDMGLSRKIGIERLKHLYQGYEVASLVSDPPRLPVTLIHGELEEEKNPLAGVCQAGIPPCTFVVVPHADHYFGTRNRFNRPDLPLEVYSARLVGSLAGAIEDAAARSKARP